MVWVCAALSPMPKCPADGWWVLREDSQEADAELPKKRVPFTLTSIACEDASAANVDIRLDLENE